MCVLKGHLKLRLGGRKCRSWLHFQIGFRFLGVVSMELRHIGVRIYLLLFCHLQ
jgi:hypothetical protein